MECASQTFGMFAIPTIRWIRLSLLATSLCIGACGGDSPGGGGTAANLAPTANAGADQTVALSSVVTLNGVGTDADGTIATYSWTQTAGTAITLTGANSATATFTTPATAGGLTFSLTVTDNRGAASAADSVIVDVQSAATLSGQVTFDFVPFKTSPNTGLDYGHIASRPARGVVVEAIDTAGGTLVLAATVTDASGNYSLSLVPGIDVFLRVKAEMRKAASAGSPSSWDFQVRDNTNSSALYAISGTSFSTSAAGTHNLHAPVAFSGAAYTDRRAAPFVVLDSVYQAFNMSLAAEPSLVFPPLNLYWSTLNRGVPEDPLTCTVAQGCISVTHYETGPAEGIYIQGMENDDTDEYDTHVIVHEWGHYFQDKFSRDDSIGGPHSLGNRLDARVAFSEGWGNALSGMALTDPVYRDSSGPQQAAEFNFSVESATTSAPGWFSETSVQGVLYDVFDAQADGADAVNLGFTPIFDVITNDVRTSDALTTIYPFARGLKARQPALAGNIDSLLAAQSIVGVHPSPTLSPDFGSAEVNDGGDARNLPIYVPIVVGMVATVTSRAAASTDASTRFNKLGNRRYLVFSLAAAHAVSIGVTTPGCAGATPTRDPDVVLFHAGSEIGRAETFGCDTLTPPGALAAGVYVIETYEFSNIDQTDGLPAGDTDIAVALN
jgi:hypothetical protein